MRKEREVLVREKKRNIVSREENGERKRRRGSWRGKEIKEIGKRIGRREEEEGAGEKKKEGK